MNFNNLFLKICLLFCCFSMLQGLYAQVGIGTNAPEASAVLDLSSTTQGFLPPRMTFTQMTAISTPTLGLMVYCTDCEPQGLYYYDGSYFLNSNRGSISGSLDLFDGSTLVHNGGNLSPTATYFESDGITTSIDFSGWTGAVPHNPISFSSTGHLGYTATLTSFNVSRVVGVLENGTTIPDSQLSASTTFGGFSASDARLNRIGQNWAAGTVNTSQWFQVDLGQTETVIGVATQGRHNSVQRIETYRIQYSNDGSNFTDYDGGALLTGNTDTNTIVRNDFNPTFTARYVRFLPQSWNAHISARFEVYILPPPSSSNDGIATFQITGRPYSSSSLDPTFNVSIGGQPLSFTRTMQTLVEQAAGLESGAIADSQLSASTEFSTNHAAIQGRLNSTAGNNWAAMTIDTSQYFQVDLGQVETVSAVATQGGHNAAQWITSYIIQYSNDGINFTNYNGGAVLTANTDQSTIVKNDFSPTFNARYVRFNPQTHQGHITGRFEVYILR